MQLSKRTYIARYRSKEELDELRSQQIDQHQIESKFPLLSLLEENLLLSYYQRDVVNYFLSNTKTSFPISVYSSACYFSRIFYLKSSLYKFDPLFVCYLCFYIAAKVEHHYMSISSYIKMLPECYRSYREDFVLKEVEVLKNINFDLNHSSIFAAIDGLLLQYEFYMNNKANTDEKNTSPYFSSKNLEDSSSVPQRGDISRNHYVMRLRYKARNKAFFLITTDLILIYPAAQLAAGLLTDDIGLDILSNICFLDNRENHEFVENQTKRYSSKILIVKEAILSLEKNCVVDWKELVKKYKKNCSRDS